MRQDLVLASCITTAIALVALIRFAVPANGQPTPQNETQAADVSKVRRYLKAEMYREAIRELEPAIRSDEFNPDLRFLYGTALRHVRRYDDSLYNLSVAVKLDGSSWAALDELLKLYMDRYAESPTNSDRISASRTAKQLLLMHGPDSAQPELQEAKRSAAEAIVHLEDPVGLWRNDRQEFKIIRSPDGTFLFVEEHPAGKKCAQACFSITFREATPPAYEGSGTNSDAICLFDFTYVLSFSDAATKLSVTGKRARYRSADPVQIPDGPDMLVALKTRDKICSNMVRDGVFAGPTREMTFERVP